MAASSNEGHCTVEGPIDSNHDHQTPATALTGVNVHDSVSHSDPNHEVTASPFDGVVVGEKRKRDNGEDTAPLADPFRKTSLCSYFRSSGGSCRHGDACKYAHGEEELRPRPDGSWDPTSKREKRSVSDEENDDGNGDNKDQDGEEGSSDVKLEKCIKNVQRRWKTIDFVKFLDNNGIPYKTAKKVKHQNLGFLRFENEEQMSRALEKLEGKSTGGNNTVEVAEVRERKFARPSEGERNADANKDNPELDVSKEKSARDVVTPLAQLSYDDQLEGKKASLEQMLKRLTRNARKACPAGVSLPDWILKSREIGGLPCKLEGIVASPIVFGYRNKCEFTIGNSLEGKPTVGFTLGNFREGMTAVGEPVDCPNVSTVAQKYTSIFQEFLQASALPVWDRHKNAGFWRQFTVREGRKPVASADAENVDAIAEVMLIIQVSSISFEKDVVAREFERLAEAFSAGAASCSPPLPLSALVVQEHQGISNVAPADAPLQSLTIPKADGDILKADGVPPAELTNGMEDPRIHDYISNLRFSISPTAFFQVNTLAAEKLYSLAGDWAGLDADTLLFDVCCGTGTIGLTLAHRVGMVVGIEMNASAVSDAHRNAEINGIKNCRFVCSKAEDVMGSLLKEYITLPEEISETAAGDNDVSSTKEGDDIKDEEMQNTNPEKENGQSHNSATVEQNNKENVSGRQFKKVVAIVDPPRGGLHPTVIKALRTHPNLRKLVYISCNPESLVANAIELCSQCPENNDEKGKKDNRGWRHMSNSGIARRRLKSMPKSEPFSPVKAMAVDLFPHTPHCEVVVLLER